MKLTKKFLQNLPVGTDRWFEDIDESNLRSIHTMCADLHRWGHPYRITKWIEPSGRRVRIKVDYYDDGQRFKNAPSNVEGNQVGTFGAKG